MKHVTSPPRDIPSHITFACYYCGAERPYSGEPCACPQSLPEPALPGVAMAVLMALSMLGVGVGLAWLCLQLVGR